MPGNGIRAVRGPQKGGIYMAQIRVKGLTFCYDGGIDNIFEDVSFSIDTDWRLGFIGRNIPRYILKV